MKLTGCTRSVERKLVAPFTGAWIEIRINNRRNTVGKKVAPFTGAWIEIRNSACPGIA